MKLLKSTFIITILLSTIMYMSPVTASEKVAPDDPRIYYLKGDVNQTMVKDFSERLEKGGVTLVILSSGGGNIFSALQIGYLIYENRLNTLVLKGQYCMSACGYIFLAGNKKLLLGKVGVHSASFEGTSYNKLSLEDKEEIRLLTWEIIHYFGYIGVHYTFFSDSLEIPSEDMVFVGKDQLNYYLTRGQLIVDTQ